MLHDFDELVMQVQDKSSQVYIIEAINTYRGGSYRTAIVATWIAVVYDLTNKFRILASQDEGIAKKYIDEVDKLVDDDDFKPETLKKSQELERIILDIAYKGSDNRDYKDGLELLTKYEYEDLSRIKNDRNLCAHPAFTNGGVLFQPTPELVRTHISHALIHLLNQKPLQGKKALEKIKLDLQSSTLPRNEKKAIDFWNHKYFDHAKPALIRETVKLYLKVLLRGDVPELEDNESSIITIFKTLATNPSCIPTYRQTMKAEFSKIASSLSDDRLIWLSSLIGIDEEAWDWLDRPTKLRFEQVIKNCKFTYLEDLMFFDTFRMKELQPLLTKAFSKLEFHYMEYVVKKFPEAVFLEGIILAWCSGFWGWDNVQPLGRMILQLTTYLSESQLEKILLEVKKNNQINTSYYTIDFLSKLFESTEKYFKSTSVLEAWRSAITIMERHWVQPEQLLIWSSMKDKIKGE